MGNYSELLLSKVIEQNNVQVLRKLGVDASHFTTTTERNVFTFIQNYAERHGGKAPSEVVVVTEFDFNYIPSVTDSFEFLVKQTKNYAAKKAMLDLLQDQAGDKFEQMDGVAFAAWLKEQSEKVIQKNATREEIGIDVVEAKDRFLEEYRKRKEGTSYTIWKSKFPTINKSVGGYTTGNMFTFFARSGKGKSVVAIEEIVEIAMSGGHCLLWSLEMGSYEMLVRIFSSISGRLGLFNVNVGNRHYEGGFEQRSLNHGKLTEEFEQAFLDFLNNMDKYIKGSITLRCVDDEDFHDRSVAQIESDILTIKEKHGSCDAVLIDPIYYLDMEKGSNVAGSDVANTSKALRRLCGKQSVVLFVITQAEEDKTIGDKDGKQTEIRVPSRASLKKSKAILEDSRLVLAMDSHDGRAIINISKSREGNEDTQIELLFLPSYGIVRELTETEIDIEQFEDTF